MNSTSSTAPTAHAFDPSLWLAQFREMGGSWIIGADDRISIGWAIHGSTQAQQYRASEFWRELENDKDKKSAVLDTLVAMCPVREARDV